MKRTSIVQMALATVAITAASSIAFAEEAATTPAAEPTTIATTTCPEPQILKSGWYLGLQGGYESYRVRNSVTTPGGAALSTLVNNPVLAVNGWVGGMMLGYSMMVNNWFQLGAEVFANKNNGKLYYSNDAAGSTYTNQFEVKSSYGLGILPGIKLTDATLSFIRLGWNNAYVKTNETVTGAVRQSENNSTNGFVFGVGFETLTAGDWSLRTEFDHTWYQSFHGGNTYSTAINPSDNQFMAAMIYHFA